MPRYKLRTLLILLAVLPPLLWIGWLTLDWCGYWSPRLTDLDIGTGPPRTPVIDDGSWAPSYPDADGNY